MINITNEMIKLQHNVQKINDIKKKSLSKKVVVIMEKENKLKTGKTIRT
jgi:hypothetical protein